MGKMSQLAADMEEAGYPYQPGWKEPTTSRDAARAAGKRSGTLRDAILGLMAVIGSCTPDEAADNLCKTVLAIRPRFAELKALGMIEETGERRQNTSGLYAKCYRLARQDQKPLP